MITDISALSEAVGSLLLDHKYRPEFSRAVDTEHALRVRTLS
ncbi:hypothetical protein [Rhodococcus opacus]|nr:hypothetical protein [Rhodococcus opacus]